VSERPTAYVIPASETCRARILILPPRPDPPLKTGREWAPYGERTEDDSQPDQNSLQTYVVAADAEMLAALLTDPGPRVLPFTPRAAQGETTPRE
jgi:hypothetical protein